MNDPYTRNLQLMLNSARYLLAICVNILVLVLILYGVSRVCICGYHFCYAVFGTVTVDQGKGQEKIFQVETNRSMYEVADKLQKQGLIVDKYSFYARTQLLEQDTVILRPGTYVSVSYTHLTLQSGFVTGCFATKIVQQSSNGWIDVSYVPIFSEISTISCLSNPINGRYTGSVHTSFVAAKLCIVWLAT